MRRRLRFRFFGDEFRDFIIIRFFEIQRFRYAFFHRFGNLIVIGFVGEKIFDFFIKRVERLLYFRGEFFVERAGAFFQFVQRGRERFVNALILRIEIFDFHDGAIGAFGRVFARSFRLCRFLRGNDDAFRLIVCGGRLQLFRRFFEFRGHTVADFGKLLLQLRVCIFVALFERLIHNAVLQRRILHFGEYVFLDGFQISGDPPVHILQHQRRFVTLCHRPVPRCVLPLPSVQICHNTPRFSYS